MPVINNRDDIDVIVDRILSYPDRADEVKSELRKCLGETPGPRARRLKATIMSSPIYEAETFWDNVPV